MTDPTDKNEDKSEEGFIMAGFSGATGVPLKQMQDAIAQSTANIKTWTTSSATSSIGTATYSVNEATKICIVGYAAGANGTGNGTITLPTTIKSKFNTYSPLRGGGYLNAAENSNIITIADSVAWGVGQIVIPFN